jgi:hypothetical protein
LVHGSHRRTPELGALQAADVGRDQPRGQVGVLPECHPDPRPPRLGGEVDLWVQRHTEPGGEVLLADDVGVSPDEVGVVQGGQAERLRPLRERTRQGLGARVVAERVAGIGRQGHRDARPARQRKLLHVVVPGHQLAYVIHLARQVEVIDPQVTDGCLGARPAERIVRGHELPTRPHCNDVVEHQAGLVLQRQPYEEILDPVRHALRRIEVTLHHGISRLPGVTRSGFG